MALLIIHKKMHARWYANVHSDRRIGQDDQWPKCKFHRTPTPVPLQIPAPSTTTTRKPLLRFAYHRRYHLGKGDSVRVMAFHHEKYGKVGILKDSMPNADDRLRVEFGDRECHHFLRSE